MCQGLDSGSLAKAPGLATRQPSTETKGIIEIMLILTRKESERIYLGDDIVLTVVRIGGDKVRIGVEAPSDLRVLRLELSEPDSQGPRRQEPSRQEPRRRAA